MRVSERECLCMFVCETNTKYLRACEKMIKQAKTFMHRLNSHLWPLHAFFLNSDINILVYAHTQFETEWGRCDPWSQIGTRAHSIQCHCVRNRNTHRRFSLSVTNMHILSFLYTHTYTQYYYSDEHNWASVWIEINILSVSQGSPSFIFLYKVKYTHMYFPPSDLRG